MHFVTLVGALDYRLQRAMMLCGCRYRGAELALGIGNVGLERLLEVYLDLVRYIPQGLK